MVSAIDPNKLSRDGIVAMLRDLLQRAEAGEFTSIHAVVFDYSDGHMSRHSAGDFTLADVVLAAELVKFELMHEAGGE